MRRILTTLIGVTAALVAAVALYVAFTLPPRARTVSSVSDPRVVWGAYHVHSDRSDGGGSIDDIARAAAEAGLHFVILTDHGDATRAPDPPQYRHGVLVLDAVELNSSGGHIVALNLAAAAPYPVAGETRDVLEDVHRLGGFAIAAHPDSPRPGLRWRARGRQDLDGIEWMNLDSAWRAHAPVTLLGSALRSLVRGPEAIASLITAPLPGLALADSTNRTDRVVLLAGLDAHARMGGDTGEGTPAAGLRYPSYRTLFRTLSQAVRIRAPWSGSAADDSAALVAGLTQGRTFSVTRAFADGLPALTFTARQGERQVEMGGALPSGAETMFLAEVRGLDDVRLQVLRDGRPVSQGRGLLQVKSGGEAGAYRVEAFVGDQPVPWLVTNPIYLTRELPPPPGSGMVAPGGSRGSEGVAIEALTVQVRPDTWRIESDPVSRAAITIDGSQTRLSYALADGPARGQYVALATGAAGSLPLDRIELVLRSAQPMRVSVQVRTPGGVDGHRWRRSFYVDATPRPISVRLSELDPVDPTSALRPVVAIVQSVLLVIDTVNARPGSSGELVVVSARLVPGRAGG